MSFSLVLLFCWMVAVLLICEDCEVVVVVSVFWRSCFSLLGLLVLLLVMMVDVLELRRDTCRRDGGVGAGVGVSMGIVRVVVFGRTGLSARWTSTGSCIASVLGLEGAVPTLRADRSKKEKLLRPTL